MGRSVCKATPHLRCRSTINVVRVCCVFIPYIIQVICEGQPTIKIAVACPKLQTPLSPPLSNLNIHLNKNMCYIDMKAGEGNPQAREEEGKLYLLSTICTSLTGGSEFRGKATTFTSPYQPQRCPWCSTLTSMILTLRLMNHSLILYLNTFARSGAMTNKIYLIMLQNGWRI